MSSCKAITTIAATTTQSRTSITIAANMRFAPKKTGVHKVLSAIWDAHRASKVSLPGSRVKRYPAHASSR